MPIYFLRCESTKLIKIGCVQKLSGLEPRMSAHRCQVSTQLTLLGILPDLHRDTVIHHKFKNLRHHAEWFRPGDDLISFIKENTVMAEEPRKQCKGEGLTGKPCRYPATKGDYCDSHNRRRVNGSIEKKTRNQLQVGDVVIENYNRIFEIISLLEETPEVSVFQVRFSDGKIKRRRVNGETVLSVIIHP